VVRDLVKEGKLEWNKPLTDYTDLGLTGDARRITAEHVLTHSTGLTNWRFQADRPLTAGFAPGSRWQYSGEGIFLLQRVVEKIVAVPIAATMKSRVLQPLGMTASTFGWTPDVASRSAAGHDRDGSPLERSLGFYARKNYDVLEKAGLQPESATYDQIVDAYQKAKAVALPITMSPNMAGSLQTTAVDYAKFVRRVLAEITQHPDDFRSRIDVNRHIAWARGWGIDRSLGTESLFHWGDGPGFKNFTWVEPARKTALVFFTNGDHGASLYAWAFHDLLREDPAAFYWI
jgi:CubicO group peptidase (beta-lactamase class C family)